MAFLFKLTLFFLLVALVAVGGGFLYYNYTINAPMGAGDSERPFAVNPGLGVKEIAHKLEKENFISSGYFFELYVYFKKSGNRLKAGEYLLKPDMSIKEIADIIENGGRFDDVKVTFPEGFSVAEMEKRMKDSGLKVNLSDAKAKDYSAYFDFFSNIPTNINLEGFLFPDTYRFKRNATTTEVIIKMLDNFNNKLAPELRNKIASQNKSIYDVIIVASLIEKEVISDEDRGIVSGIIWKRMGMNMPLQIDATITYITGKKTTMLTHDDLKIDSPYNTYVNVGLPPGPISNPGLSSIKAAVYPQESPYLYYLTKSDGETVFSSTLQEHNSAKAKYLK